MSTVFFPLLNQLKNASVYDEANDEKFERRSVENQKENRWFEGDKRLSDDKDVSCIFFPYFSFPFI